MSRKVNRPPYRQDDPSPGGARRGGRRIFVFVVIVVFAGVELAAGAGLQTVLMTVLGVGLAGALVGRWVCDDGALPDVTRLLGHSGVTR
jgi:hypothetical protein